MPISPSDLEEVLAQRFRVDDFCTQIDEQLRALIQNCTNDLPPSLDVTCVAMPVSVASQVAQRYLNAGWPRVEVKHERTDRASYTIFSLCREPRIPQLVADLRAQRAQSPTPGYAGEPTDTDFGGRD